MGSDDHSGGGVEWLGIDDGGDRGAGAEILETGPGGRHRWPRWAPLILVLVAGLAIALLVTQPDSGHSAAAVPSSAPTSSLPTSALPTSALPTAIAPSTRAATPVIPTFTSAPTPVIPTFGSPVPPARKTSDLGHPILGITAGYELFASGPDAVVRVQLRAGRITTTGLPRSHSAEPVSLLVGEHQVIARVMGGGRGYLIPDHGAADELTGELAHAGRLLPGPDPAHLWVEPLSATPSRDSLRLVDFHGTPTSTRIRLPAGFWVSGPDGTGYALANGPGGVYEVREGGLSRITHGAVLAVGRSGWLARQCDRHAHCNTVYIDRTSGSRHQVPIDLHFGKWTSAQGVIAPDGSTAAVLQTDLGVVTVHVIDLSSGTQWSRSWPTRNSVHLHQMRWSPDSRWLFVATGRLTAIDTRTHEPHLVPGVSPRLSLTEVAIRSATMKR